METRYLKTLVATVEEGSFSRAAEVLYITQSAVSQRIKFLEEHFGQKTTGSFTIVARGEPGSGRDLVTPVKEAAARAAAELPTSEVASVMAMRRWMMCASSANMPAWL